MLQGKLVGTVKKEDVTTDEVLAMIILGKLPGEVTQKDLAELHLSQTISRSAACPPATNARRSGG